VDCDLCTRPLLTQSVVAKVPTLAPHFGAPAQGPFNPETQMVPIVGLDNSDMDGDDTKPKKISIGPVGSFAATQPPRLVRAIANELNIQSRKSKIPRCIPAI